MYIYIYMYKYVNTNKRARSLVHAYIYMCIHSCVYIYASRPFPPPDQKIGKLKLCSPLHYINPACKPGAILPHG